MLYSGYLGTPPGGGGGEANPLFDGGCWARVLIRGGRGELPNTQDRHSYTKYIIKAKRTDNYQYTVRSKKICKLIIRL